MAEQVQTLPATIQSLTAADLFDGDTETVEQVLAEVEDAARSVVSDVSTDKGRRAVASLAAKVARSKTFLDGLGKDHVAELKRRAGQVDAKRRTIRDRLDVLKAEVRQPLTDYEQREADRQAAIRERIQVIRAEQEAAHFQDGTSVGSAEVEAAIERVAAVLIDDSFEEFRAEAEQVKDATLYRLNQVLSQFREREAAEAKAEAERAERERREREAREAEIAQQAAAQARREAEQAAAAEQRRAEAERAEAERRARAAEQEAAAAAERERRRIEAEQEREREDAARRAADREHQAQVHREVLADLCDLGLSEVDAKRVIGAVASGRVAHVRIDY